MKVRKTVDQTIAFVTCTMLAFMVLTAVWQVFTRYVLNSPSTVSEEILRYSLIWVSMLGASYAFGKKKHIAIELLAEKLPKNKALALSIMIETLILLFAMLVMVIGGSRIVALTMAQSSASLGLPMGYIYLSLPVSGVLIIGYSLMTIYEAAFKKKTNLYADHLDTASNSGIEG
ncbi:TRAP transporter small permease [Metabacillus indicus]|uniref:C4-dicarboxylate ABC transporter n=1 Tax=Metabacillus indicus TaxID=246786 RepID=A0A084H206_METID|nr:TRAP transporter small permease [Metabacillus indicus]KEZ52422.1 C4-dicarboxylate ABC transporter [Metabacillus indicus LMG 22858]KEZ53618.1 C4-dicarboxylate ABC transporter [Metabacillus indicus]